MHMAGIITIFSVVVLTGCQTPGYYSGEEGIALNVVNSTRVAADFVPLLEGTFNRGTTVFAMPPDMQRKPVGKALMTELRRAGYGVAGDGKNEQNVVLGYEVDGFGEGVVRVALVAGSHFSASRLYEENDDGVLEPETSFTAWREPAAPGRHKAHSALVALLQPPEPPAPDKKVPPPATEKRSETAAAATPAAVAPPPAPPAVLAVEPAPMAATKPIAAKDGREPQDRDIVQLVPNKDNVIVVSPALFVGHDAAVPNPFLQKYQPKTLPHEVTITISGIVLGPQPTVIINDRLFSLKDKFETFELTAIEKDKIVLARNNCELLIPIQEEGTDPVKVRYQ